MRPQNPKLLVAIAALGILIAAAFFTRHAWLEWLFPREGDDDHAHAAPPPRETQQVKVTAQARKNLRLVSSPVQLQTYMRTIQVPGVIIDRPGLSDRGVAAPAVSIVTKVHAFPGDTVKVGDRLFTLRLSSEYLQNTQTELFKASGEAELVKKQKVLLKDAVEAGAVSTAKIIELDNQLQRLTTAMQAYRQDLLTRGLTPAQVTAAASGKFVSEIDVLAPAPATDAVPLVNAKAQPPDAAKDSAPAYEVQDLKAELGQQVQAGQLLAVLANHHALYIEGHSFRREARFLEEAARKGWQVRVDLGEEDGASAPGPKDMNKAEDSAAPWPPLDQELRIRHLANTVDPVGRTFTFYVPLANQARSYVKGDKTFIVWRFRPGQRVRLHVPVEQLADVIVLPAAAVVREGPEAWVFVQNDDIFTRRPVHVLYEDRLDVVLEADKSLRPRLDYIAQGAAASLNRILKAQSADGGLPAGAHFHADGSLHIPGK